LPYPSVSFRAAFIAGVSVSSILSPQILHRADFKVDAAKQLGSLAI
jgi:hypothetical protein